LIDGFYTTMPHAAILVASDIAHDNIMLFVPLFVRACRSIRSIDESID